MAIEQLYQELTALAQELGPRNDDDYKAFMLKALELDQALQDENEQDYKNLQSPATLKHIEFLTKLSQTALDVNLQIIALRHLSLKHSNAIPKAGLSLEDSPLKESVEWSEKMLAHGDKINSAFIFEQKHAQADWLSKLYARRNNPLKVVNCLGNWLLAMAKCSFVVENPDSFFYAVTQLTAISRELPPHVTLESKEIKLLILALVTSLKVSAKFSSVDPEGTAANDAGVLNVLALLLAKTPQREGQEPYFQQAAFLLKKSTNRVAASKTEGLKEKVEKAADEIAGQYPQINRYLSSSASYNPEALEQYLLQTREQIQQNAEDDLDFRNQCKMM